MKLLLSPVCAVFALALTASCRATIGVEAGPATPIFGGSKLKVEIDGRRVSIGEDSPAIKKGDCIKLTWADADGNPIGSVDVTAGGPAAQAPPGADSVRATPCDPPKKDDAAAGVDRLLAPFYFRVLPLDLATGHGRYLEFNVQADSLDSAELVADAFQKNPMRPLTAGVECSGFLDVRMFPSGSMRMTVVTPEVPQALSIAWNSVRVAHLNDCRTWTCNGWYGASLDVPANALFTGNNVFGYQALVAGEFRELTISVTTE